MPKRNTANRPSERPPVLTKFLVWALAVLALLPVAAVLAVHVPALQNEIILHAVKRIESSTDYKVDLESFTWWPFSRIYLSNVHVQAQGRRILECREIRVNYGLTFTWPYIMLEEVYLEKPFLQLEKSADGKWQVPEAGGGGAKSVEARGEPVWLQIGLPKVQIVSGTIEARQQGNVIISVKDVSGAINLKTVQGPDGPRIRIDLEMLRAQISSSEFGTWSIEGSLALDGPDLSIRSISIASPEGGRGEIKGSWDAAGLDRGKIDVILSGFSFAAVPALHPGPDWARPFSGSISIGREGAAWTVAHDISAESGNMRGTVDLLRTSEDRYDAKIDSRLSDFGVHATSYTPEAKLNGRLSATVRVDGGRLTEAFFTVNLLDSTIGSETVRDCDLTGSFQDEVLSVKSSVLRSSLADITFSAEADLGGLWDPRHKGGFKAEVGIERANLRRIGPKLPQRAAGGVRVEAGYEAGDFLRPRLWTARAEANVNIPEFVGLKASGSYRAELLKVDYDLDARDVRKFAGLYPQWQGQGRVLSRGNVSGKWPDLLWEGEAVWQRWEYAASSADQITVRGRSSLAAREDRREISLQARNVAFRGNKIAAMSLDLDQQKAACSYKLKAEGILGQGGAHLSGRIDRIWDFPLLSVSTLGRFSWKDRSGTVEARFDLLREGVKIQSASIQQGNQRAVVSGGLIADSRVELKIGVESVSVGQVIAALGLKENVSGIVSGQIQVGGRPESPEGRLTLKGTDFVIAGKQRIDHITIQGTYSRDTLVLQGDANARELRAPLALTARVPVRISFKPPVISVRQTDPVSAEIKVAGIDAGVALPYLKFLGKLGGEIRGEIRCSGTIRQPVVSGSGVWSKGFFQERRWPHIIDNIQGEWQADSKRLNVTRAEVSHLGGSVSVTGYIDWPQFKTLGFKATGTNLHVRNIYGIEGTVSGQAEIRDSPTAAELTGRLVFSKAHMSLVHLEKDIAQRIQIIEADSKDDLFEFKESKSPSEFGNRLKMDVELELPQSGAWVTGKGLNAEIVGGLKLQKVPVGPIRLAGELQATRGTYTFQGKELKIVEGSLVFTGSPEPDPQMRILCQKQVRDITLQAVVSGPLSKPKLAMSSIPAMNQIDVLSYLMFDHAAGDLSSSESSQFRNRAAAWLGSEASTALKSVFGNSPLAPDSLRYRSTTGGTDHGFSYSQSSVSTNARETGMVEIGKHITPDLYVTYGRGITGEEGNQVQLEYRVNRHMSIQTQVGGAEQSGVDVFWRHDFGK